MIGQALGFCQEPRYRVYDTLSLCFFNEDAVAAVILHGWSNVPAFLSVQRPGFAYVRFFVGNDLCSGVD